MKDCWALANRGNQSNGRRKLQGRCLFTFFPAITDYLQRGHRSRSNAIGACMPSQAKYVHEGCIFCGSNKRPTREHIYADWMKAYLPRIGDRTIHVVKHGPESLKKGRMNRPGDFFSQKLRVVCDKCNNGWMSVLQKKSKPILVPLLLGDWSKCRRTDLKILAQWTVMFVMVSQYIDPATAVIPFDVRERFMTDKAVPRNWRIWLGLVDFGSGVHPGQRNHMGGFVKDASTEPQETIGYFSTTGFTVGKLFVQVLSTSHQEAFSSLNVGKFAKKHGVRSLAPRPLLMLRRPVRTLNWDEFFSVTNDLARSTGYDAFSLPLPSTAY